MKEATVNYWGNILCPECLVSVITDEGYVWEAGVCKCKICKSDFMVTKAVIDQAKKIETEGPERIDVSKLPDDDDWGKK